MIRYHGLRSGGCKERHSMPKQLSIRNGSYCKGERERSLALVLLYADTYDVKFGGNK